VCGGACAGRVRRGVCDGAYAAGRVLWGVCGGVRGGVGWGTLVVGVPVVGALVGKSVSASVPNPMEGTALAEGIGVAEAVGLADGNVVGVYGAGAVLLPDGCDTRAPSLLRSCCETGRRIARRQSPTRLPERLESPPPARPPAPFARPRAA
jgi:hypothetical protein